MILQCRELYLRLSGAGAMHRLEVVAQRLLLGGPITRSYGFNSAGLGRKRTRILRHHYSHFGAIQQILIYFGPWTASVQRADLKSWRMKLENIILWRSVKRVVRRLGHALSS